LERDVVMTTGALGPAVRAERAFFAGRFDEAKALFLREVCREPQSAAWVHSSAIVFANLRDWESSCRFFDRAVKLEPASPTGFLELGKALFERGDFAAAILALQGSLVLDPALKSGLLHLSLTLRGVRAFDDSARLSRRAWLIDPLDSSVLRELGYSRRDSGLFELSIDSLSRSIAIDPNQPGNFLTLASCELHLGNFDRGWRLYEFRWRANEFLKYHRESALRRWSGQSWIQGQKLLLFSEQGFGDTIMFLRFIGDLDRFSAEITLMVPPGLERLCGQLSGVHTVTSRIPSDLFAACCPLMSLPAVLSNTLENIPHACGAYLHPARDLVESWRELLGEPRGPRIGVCWSGGENPTLAERSIPLREFSSLFGHEAEFISLHKDVRDHDLEAMTTLAGSLRHFGEEHIDFCSTAALIDLTEIVISVDTAIAHLAGAMGKEVWIILPKRADWRWLQDRSDSPWYPRARLFRQTIDGDWSGPLNEVAAALAERYGLEARS
jgi:tetratricopeptide (TPR) repeat protein